MKKKRIELTQQEIITIHEKQYELYSDVDSDDRCNKCPIDNPEDGCLFFNGPARIGTHWLEEEIQI